MAADVAFARALHAGGHLLWAEDASLPDVVPAKQRVDDELDVAPESVVVNNPCGPRCVLRVDDCLFRPGNPAADCNNHSRALTPIACAMKAQVLWCRPTSGGFRGSLAWQSNMERRHAGAATGASASS